MKYLLMITIVIFITGCTEHRNKKSNDLTIRSSTDIIKEDREKVANFILQCAKNANPMSDEEGEDLVRQCNITADNIYGVQRLKICVDQHCFNYKWCDDATLPNEIKACRDNGWVKK